MTKGWTVAVAFVWLLLGCAQAPAPTSVADVDWARAEVATITLTAFAAQPTLIELRKGRPYRLVLRNVGDSRQMMEPAGFFGAIAPWKLVTTGPAVERPIEIGGTTGSVVTRLPGRVTERSLVGAPPLRALELDAGETTELYLVPLIPGDYPLDCTSCDGARFGLAARIRITEP